VDRSTEVAEEIGVTPAAWLARSTGLEPVTSRVTGRCLRQTSRLFVSARDVTPPQTSHTTSTPGPVAGPSAVMTMGASASSRSCRTRRCLRPRPPRRRSGSSRLSGPGHHQGLLQRRPVVALEVLDGGQGGRAGIVDAVEQDAAVDPGVMAPARSRTRASSYRFTWNGLSWRSSRGRSRTWAPSGRAIGDGRGRSSGGLDGSGGGVAAGFFIGVALVWEGQAQHLFPPPPARVHSGCRGYGQAGGLWSRLQTRIRLLTLAFGRILRTMA
jgi:hypothetical protein